MKLPFDPTTTLPLRVAPVPENVSASPSASAPINVPTTRPVAASALPTLAEPVGAVFSGAIVRFTATPVEPPYPSLTVTVNESVFCADVAVSDAAACRAAAVGV